MALGAPLVELLQRGERDALVVLAEVLQRADDAFAVFDGVDPAAAGLES
ncbi:hypothetical protein ACFQL4_04620 [Halosimplex aquaticum]